MHEVKSESEVEWFHAFLLQYMKVKSESEVEWFHAFLLQCMKVKSESEVVSCIPTPMHESEK